MSFELPTERATFQRDNIEYSEVLRTISALVEMDPHLIAQALDHLSHQVKPLLKQGETFENLAFGLQVFPDDNDNTCYFSIQCGEYGAYTLKYDPVAFVLPRKKPSSKIDRSAAPGPLIALDDPEIGERLVLSADDAVLSRIESLTSDGTGSEEGEDGSAEHPATFQLIAAPTAPSVREPQTYFGGLADRFSQVSSEE